MAELPSDKLDYISDLITGQFQSLSSIEDILDLVDKDLYLLPKEKLFAMFAMGRRYENNKLRRQIDAVFMFGHHEEESEEDYGEE